MRTTREGKYQVKKVRYLAGAAGLVPAVAAFMAPATVHAAAQAQTAHPNTPKKSTSLHVTYLGNARPGEQGGCGSVSTGWINHNHMSIRFWYNAAGCVGTVELKLYPQVISSCMRPEFFIYPHDQGTYQWANGHSYCYNTELVIPVQKTFNTPLGVWGQAWTEYLSKENAGPAGKNVDPPF
jgi:hypothetical protein